MKVIKEGEPEVPKSEVIHFAIADNCLSGPEACIKHVLGELAKAGHTVQIFTQNDVPEEWVTDLLLFLPKIGYEGKIYTRSDVSSSDDVDMFVDERNYGGWAGWYAFYGSLIQGPVIALTKRNLNLLRDYTFWTTGKEGLNLDGKVTPKIILPGQGN